MKALEILQNAKMYAEHTNNYPTPREFDEAIEELEALQSRSCKGCKYCTKVFSYTYPLCTRDEQSPFQIHNKEVLFCNRYEPKEKQDERN